MSGFVQQSQTISTFSNSDSWVILSEIEQSIKNKIEALGTPLKQWDINIFRGVLTGYNDAFIISTDKKNEILSNCQTDLERKKTAEIIRPILRGRDIQKYHYEWADLWIIWVPWHFPLHLDSSIQGASKEAEERLIKEYPALYQHLLYYKKDLSARNKAETGIRYEWYALQRWGSNYWEDFSKPKILWKRIGSILRFSYDVNGCFGLDSTCFLTGQHVEYLTCVLNSRMGRYLLQNAPKTGTGDLLISVQAVEPIRIPIPDSQTDDYFKGLLANSTNYSSSDFQAAIDDAVWKLYGLTEDEILYISNLGI